MMHFELSRLVVEQAGRPWLEFLRVLRSPRQRQSGSWFPTAATP
jgi:hypothetical protein